MVRKQKAVEYKEVLQENGIAAALYSSRLWTNISFKTSNSENGYLNFQVFLETEEKTCGLCTETKLPCIFFDI